MCAMNEQPVLHAVPWIPRISHIPNSNLKNRQWKNQGMEKILQLHSFDSSKKLCRKCKRLLNKTKETNCDIPSSTEQLATLNKSLHKPEISQYKKKKQTTTIRCSEKLVIKIHISMKKEHDVVVDWNLFYSYVSAHLVCREKKTTTNVAIPLYCHFSNTYVWIQHLKLLD